MMKYFLLTLISVVLAAGCATSPTTSTSESFKVQPKFKPVVSYQKSVRSMAESTLKPGICGKASAKLKTQWAWRDAIDAASACMRSRDFTKVDEIGNELSTREPSAPWGPYFLASASRERGELERALWMSELALKRAPDIGVVHYLRAQVLWDKKEFGPAVAGFEKSLDYDSSILPAHLFLGQVYFRDQEYSKASKHFYAVLKVNPRNPVALSGLAESELRENNPRGALDAYSRLVASNPKDGQYLMRMAEIYEGVLHDVPAALDSYRQAKALSKNNKGNSDPELDAKIRELELATQKTRAMASTEEKEKVR